MGNNVFTGNAVVCMVLFDGFPMDGLAGKFFKMAEKTEMSLESCDTMPPKKSVKKSSGWNTFYQTVAVSVRQEL